MGLISQIIKAFAPQPTRSEQMVVIGSANTTYAETLVNDLQLRRDNVELMNRGTGLAHICAVKVASALASTPYVLKRGTPGHDKVIEDHPALALLADPNTADTGYELLFRLFYQAQIAGTGFIAHDAEEARPPLDMVCLFTQYTNIEVDGTTGDIAQINTSRSRVKVANLDPRNVLIYKWNPSPYEPHWGVGALAPVVRETDVLSATIQAELAEAMTGGRPAVSLTVPRGTTADMANSIRASWQALFGGPNKRGVPFVASDVTVTPIGWAPKDRAANELWKRTQEVVCAAFGVPAALVMMDDKAIIAGSGGRVSAARAQFIDETIEPRARQFCAWLNEKYLPLFGKESKGLYFEPQIVRPDVDMAKEESNRKNITAGIVTVDEVRSEMGMKPLAAKPKSDAEVVKSCGCSVHKAAPKAVTKQVTRASKIYANAKRKDATTDIEGEEGVDAPVTDSERDAIALAVLMWYEEDVRFKVEGASVTMDKRVAEDKLAKRIVKAIAASYLAGVAFGGKQVAGLGGEPKPEYLAAARAEVERVASEISAKAARSITNTVYERVMSSVQIHFEGAGSVADVRTVIAQTMQELRGVQPVLVGETESWRAAIDGAYKAYIHSGIVQGVKWVHVGHDDDMLCEFCEASRDKMNGGEKGWPLNTPIYKNGEAITGTLGGVYLCDYGDVYGPPLHPGDHCFVFPA